MMGGRFHNMRLLGGKWIVLGLAALAITDGGF
jgi:hypothetical protein